MDFDQLLVRFFGTKDIDALGPEALAGGMTRLRLQFSLEKDEEQRFGLWCLMYLLGVAPDADEVFKDEADRAAAHEFMADADEELDGD